MKGASSSSATSSKALLADGADPNQALTSDGRTPVFIAAESGHLDVVKALLANGADPNQARTNGWTPLRMSEDFKHAAVAAALRAAGACP